MEVGPDREGVGVLGWKAETISDSLENEVRRPKLIIPGKGVNK